MQNSFCDLEHEVLFHWNSKNVNSLIKQTASFFSKHFLLVVQVFVCFSSRKNTVALDKLYIEVEDHQNILWL
jgi:hypothetical protein